MRRYETLPNPGSLPAQAIPYLTPEDFQATLSSQVGTGRRIGMLAILPALETFEHFNGTHNPLLLVVVIADDLQRFIVFMTDAVVLEKLALEKGEIEPFMRALGRHSDPGIPPSSISPGYALQESNAQGIYDYWMEGPIILKARYRRHAALSSLSQALLREKSPLALLQCATALPLAQGCAFAMLSEALMDSFSGETQNARFILLELERSRHYLSMLRDIALELGLHFLARAYAKNIAQLSILLERLTGTKTGRWSILPGRTIFRPIKIGAFDILSDIKKQNRRLLNHPLVVSRLDRIGVITPESADELALSGFGARACGRPVDIRKGLPYDFYRHIDLDFSLASGGSVYTRTAIAAKEVEAALSAINGQVLADEHLCHAVLPFKDHHFAIAAVEAPSGQLLHAALSDGKDQIAWYQMSDAITTHALVMEKALTGAFFDDRHLIIKSFALHNAIYAP